MGSITPHHIYTITFDRLLRMRGYSIRLTTSIFQVLESFQPSSTGVFRLSHTTTILALRQRSISTIYERQSDEGHQNSSTASDTKRFSFTFVREVTPHEHLLML